MEQRVVDFIRGLRAAGVRVSISESVDALNAVDTLGVQNRDLFRSLLRATLIKNGENVPVFEELFPLYFGSGGPALQNALDDLTGDEQEMLKAALQAMSGQIDDLLDWLTSGEGPTKEELEKMAEQAGSDWANSMEDGKWVTRRMLQEMGMGQLEEKLQQLIQKLQEMGMSNEAIQKLLGVVEANREALEEQAAQAVGQRIAEQRAKRPDDLHGSDLMNKPFDKLTQDESAILRKEVQRLVTQMRSRAALRRKRGKKGKFDSKSSIRANQRYGGVPLELKFKRQKMKPSLVLICDMSRSMLSVAEFMLRLTYEMQDQVSKTRSFGFYSDMEEISVLLVGSRPSEAVDAVLDNFYSRAPRHYATDLGTSLETFFGDYLDSVDGRTTVVVLGDSRNNYYAARADLIQQLQRRARKLFWFNPEAPGQWGTGDSDMLQYAPHCDGVFVVRNLAQLASAVDKLMAS